MKFKKPERKPIKLGRTIKVADLSEDTIDVINHFGLEAPHLLNEYSIILEDALIEQVNKHAQACQLIKQLQETIVQLETKED